MHPNETFLKNDIVGELAKSLAEAIKLGPAHVDAMKEQAIRLGILIEPNKSNSN